MTNKPDLYQQGFIDGAKYAIEYLMDLFDGVEDTDIYKDYFNDEEPKLVAFDKWLENKENN